MSIEAVLSGKDFADQGTLPSPDGRSEDRHARLYHPFYRDLFEGKLPIEAVRIWAKEAWGIFAYNVAINTAKLVRCQMSGIHDPEIHKKFVDVIHSEVGYSYFKDRRGQCWAIGRCFCAYGDAIGIPAGELERLRNRRGLLPTTVFARVGWMDIALRSNHILEQVAATNCCNEYSNHLTGGKFFRRISKITMV